ALERELALEIQARGVPGSQQDDDLAAGRDQPARQQEERRHADAAGDDDDRSRAPGLTEAVSERSERADRVARPQTREDARPAAGRLIQEARPEPSVRVPPIEHAHGPPEQRILRPRGELDELARLEAESRIG